MIGNLIKCWHERLFYVERKNVIPRRSDLTVEMIPVTQENASWVRELRGAEYEKQFLDQLSMGDFGYFACVDEKADRRITFSALEKVVGICADSLCMSPCGGTGFILS